jgi:hypothetical protein
MDRIIKNDYLVENLINDPLYEILKDGSIWTFKSRNGTIKSELRPIKLTRSNGYLGFCYNKVFILLHRIIYRKFIGNLFSNLVINHKDGKRDNNSLDNLELVTDSENARHSHRELNRKKTKFFGEANPRSKFKNSQIEEIRKSYASKTSNITDLSRLYDVSRITIRNIVLRKTYK